MSAFGIIQLHDDITRSNGNYCSICFRSASERRLVDPVFLNIFLMNTNGRKYFKKPIKTCYMCEALATSAVRLQRAVELASQVGVLYDDITATGHWQSVVKCLMDRQTAPNKSRGITGSILQRALSMDSTLRKAPRYELFTTDTLVVSSGKDKSPPPPAPVVTPAQPARPPPLSDTVVIVEDEEQCDAQEAPAHLRVVNQETNEVVLHPVLKGSDGKLYVPSLHLEMLDEGVFQGVTDFQMQNLLPPQTTTPTNNNLYIQNNLQTPQQTVTQSNTNNNLYINNNSQTATNNSQNQTFVHTPRKTYSNKKKNNQQKAEKTDYYNFLLTQNDEKQNGSNLDIIKMNDINIVLHSDVKKRRLPKDPLNIGSTQNCLNKQHIENSQGTEMRYEIIDDETETPANGMTESRQPVPRTDQTVDWEDKIPMDVISFMDATDPNPSERIMQPPSLPPPPPLAVIADVRSVPDVPDVPDVTHVPELIECIDLC